MSELVGLGKEIVALVRLWLTSYDARKARKIEHLGKLVCMRVEELKVEDKRLKSLVDKFWMSV